MLFLLIPFSLAQELLYTEEVSTSFEDVQVSFDEQWVAFTTGSTGQLHLLSLADWETRTMDVCTGSVGAITFTDDSMLTVGCDSTGLIMLDPKDGDVQLEIPVDTDGFQYSALYEECSDPLSHIHPSYRISCARAPSGTIASGTQPCILSETTIITNTY